MHPHLHADMVLFINQRIQVDMTVSDYYNIEGRNIPLWLNGDYALRYAGIDNSFTHEAMWAQPRLNEDAALVTIILPTAFHLGGLERIQPSFEKLRQLAQGGTVVHAYGLNGPVRTGEIFGLTVGAIKEAMQNNESCVLFANPFSPDPLYQTNDPNNKVPYCVLDLRSRWNLERYVGDDTFFSLKSPPERN